MCGVSSDWHERNNGDVLLVLNIFYVIKSFAGVTSLQFVLHTPCQFYEVIVPHDGQMSPQLVWFDIKSVKVKHRMMDGMCDVSVFLVLNRFCFASCLNAI